MAVDIDTNHSALLNFVHAGLFVGQTGTHQVGPLEDKSESALIGSESGVHIGIRMQDFHGRDAIFLNPNEMCLFVNNNVLRLVILSSLHLVGNHSGFFGEEQFDLSLWELGPLY